MTLEEAKKIIKSECYIADLLNLDRTQMVNTALDMAIMAIIALEKTRWIPISERPPEEIGTYMTTVDYGKHGLATGQRYYHGKGLGWEDDCVIAWQPLPQPYKAEGSDEE